ncbi:MAG: tRNA (adenosine(37)-N6)-threonylcarbamoyltransferase complex ATPase subunit type 1 TsaE [Chloroflexota bacterium]
MPILDANTFEFFSRSPAQTRRVGMRLGAYLERGDLVCLHGELGSGKTTLMQGIASGWGSLDLVSSPSFVLVNVYRHLEGGELFHLDAFRLRSAAEAMDLDLDNMLNRGPLVVEWPEHIRAILPSEHLWITLEWMNEEHRSLRFIPRAEHYITLLQFLRQQLYGVT